MQTAPRSGYSPKLCTIQHTLTEIFGNIRHDHDYPFASGALWSTHNLLEFLLDQIGSAELVLATWSISTAGADKLLDWKATGRLTKISAIVDWRVQVRTPGVLPLAKQHFTDIRVSSCHAKAFVLRNAEWDLSLVGSANLTNNPRIECGHLSTSREVAAFHAGWIMAEIQNAKPFGMDMRKAKKDGRQ